MIHRHAAAFLMSALARPGSEIASPPVQFEAAIDVSLSTVVVRVVDTWGQPIPDLSPKDFRVRVGKVEVPVVAVDWTSGDDPARHRRRALRDGAAEMTAVGAPPHLPAAWCCSSSRPI